MSGSGVLQLVRRIAAAGFICAAFVRIGGGQAWAVAGLLLAGLAVYAFWPSVSREPGALTMRRGSAVIGPDLLGFSLLGFFVALPVWLGRAEGAGGIHQSAWLIWIMLPAPLLLLGIGAANACLSVSIAAEGLTVTRMRETARLRWEDIAGWRRWRRGLPRLLRLFVPFLPPGQAGAVLLARDSTGIELQLGDGRRLRLPREGFEHGETRILCALGEHGVSRLDDARRR